MSIADNPLPVIGRPASSNFRWFVAAMLFMATTINYLDRQILALLKPILDHELGWTNEQYGYVHSAFFGVYAVSYAVFGWFIDKAGTKVGFSVSIFLWSLAALSHSFAGSVRGFLCARIALGAGEGGNYPACIKATAHWFPKRERALTASLFNASTNAGAIVGPAIVPWIAYTFGWRMAFIVAGVAGFFWLLVWLPFYKEFPEQSRFVSAAEIDIIESDKDVKSDSSGRVSWLRLLALRQTWAIVLAKFLSDPVWWFFLIWLPDFFKKTRGLDLKNSWIHLITIYTISTVLCVAGGWFSGHLMNRGWVTTKARKTAMLLFALCVVPVSLATQSSNWVAVLLIGLAAASHHAWSATVLASTTDMFPKRAVAAVAGITGMAGAVGGMLFPAFAGRLLDYYKSTAGGESAGYAVLFGICSSAYVVAFVLNHLLAPRFEQVDLDAK